jgi:hypothetical protein
LRIHSLSLQGEGRGEGSDDQHHHHGQQQADQRAEGAGVALLLAQDWTEATVAATCAAMAVKRPTVTKLKKRVIILGLRCVGCCSMGGL